MKKTLIVISASLSASACFAVTDNSRFHEEGPNEQLTMSLRDMQMHIGEQFEFKIIDEANVVRTHGIIMPLKATPDEGRFIFNVPEALPGLGTPGYRIDFFADQDRNQKYNFSNANYYGGDHSWRVMLDVNQPPSSLAAVTRADGVCRVNFSHCPCSFTDLNDFPETHHNPPTELPGGARIEVDDVMAFAGKMIQIRVTELPPTRHVVGLYRSIVPTAPTAFFLIPNCVDSSTPYDIDLYIDANDNNDGNGNGYDNPAEDRGDLGWRQRVTSGDGAAALSVTFKVSNTNVSDPNAGHIDVGAP